MGSPLLRGSLRWRQPPGGRGPETAGGDGPRTGPDDPGAGGKHPAAEQAPSAGGSARRPAAGGRGAPGEVGSRTGHILLRAAGERSARDRHWFLAPLDSEANVA